jgi:methionyl-tRNA formyltransferase
VAAVITRPDAPTGRGRHVEPSPVAVAAAAAGLEVLKPLKPSDPEFKDRLREIAPDCCPITAYGALIPQSVLDIPARGWVNLHFSVLPAWRGAAPVQNAIRNGDDITGATTFQLVRELDAGPVYGVLTESIRATDTAGTLLERLSAAGASLLVTTLDMMESGQLEARPQPADGISLAPKVTTADAEVNWKLPARAVDRLIRACTPAPGAWTTLDGSRVKLGPVTAADEAGTPVLGPGELSARRDGVLVGTATSPVRLGDVQPGGKRQMSAAEWVRGMRLPGGQAVLG